ncbi:hypothetical protein BG004_002420 [Podila humilis]|nr:hypothetical protein BG004_002420 [Podila humilis]
MKIQAFAIVNPILLLSFATRSTTAAAISAEAQPKATDLIVGNVANAPSNSGVTIEHNPLDRGLTTAVKPELIGEMAGEKSSIDIEENQKEEEGEEEEEEEEKEEREHVHGDHDDKAKFEDDCDQEQNDDEDQDQDEGDEDDDLSDVDKPYVDDEDIELAAIKIGDYAQELNTGSHPAKQDPLTEDSHGKCTIPPSFSASSSKRPPPTLQKRDDNKDNSDTTAPTLTSRPIDRSNLSALATAEPGGACVDSFVNFALRFQEHCTIYCLKTFTHIFVKPNVLGVLDCFACSNFIVQGFYALGQDCVGLFTSNPMTPEDLRRAKTNHPTDAGTDTGTTTAITAGGEPLAKDKSADDQRGSAVQDDTTGQAQARLSMDGMMENLKNVDFEQVNGWLEFGKGIVTAINTGVVSTNEVEATQEERDDTNKASTEGTPSVAPIAPVASVAPAPVAEGEELVEIPSAERGQMKVQRQEKNEKETKFPKVDRDQFNNFVIQAAKFANIIISAVKTTTGSHAPKYISAPTTAQAAIFQKEHREKTTRSRDHAPRGLYREALRCHQSNTEYTLPVFAGH